MTIRQLIHGGPAKANELLARLAETGDGAVKTRERLFAELKAELELLVGLEEKHLFPALRKHKEAKELVADAQADNKQVRVLLAELDGMPKEGGDFLRRLAELRRVFQQHVRDEKRELLPVVRQALSEDEAQAVVERIEADKTAVEETKRQEDEDRRAEARRAREEAERQKAAAEKAEREEAERRKAEARREREEVERQKAEAEAAERAARETGAAIARSAEDVAQGGLRLVEAGAAAAEVSAAAAARGSRQAVETAGQTWRRTAASASGVTRRYGAAASEVLKAEADLAELWLALAGEQAKDNVETFRRLAATRDWREVLEVQGAFARASFERVSELNRRYLEIVRGLAEAAPAAVERARKAG